MKLAYLTGILPIKKYKSESALNNFDEFTMTSPGRLAEYVGFTEQEVKSLCEEYDMDWTPVINAIQKSEQLLADTWNQDSAAVAKAVGEMCFWWGSTTRKGRKNIHV